MFGQAPLAAGVDLDVPVDGQRRPEFGLLLLPAPRKGELPRLHAGFVVGHEPDLAPQRLDLGAAVETKNGAPFARCLVAQALRVAHPRQGHEGQEEQDRGQAVVALRQQGQEAGLGEQAFLQQGRQRGENAAEAHAAGGSSELRFDRSRQSAADQHPSRDIAGRAPHRRLPVPPVARAAIRLRLRLQPRCRRRPGGTGTLLIDTAFRRPTRVRRHRHR